MCISAWLSSAEKHLSSGILQLAASVIVWRCYVGAAGPHSERRPGSCPNPCPVGKAWVPASCDLQVPGTALKALWEVLEASLWVPGPAQTVHLSYSFK